MPYSISSRFAYTLKYVLCSKALMQFAKFYFVKKGEKKFIKFYFSTVFFRKLHNVCNFTKKLFFFNALADMASSGFFSDITV